MEIIRQGENPMFRGTCTMCGCQFRCTVKESHQYTACRKATCPTCGEEVKVSKEMDKSVLDGIEVKEPKHY